MNKFGIVLGAAAVVTLAGCKDPDYKHASAVPSQGEVKSVETSVTPMPVQTIEPAPEPIPVAEPAPVKPVSAPVVAPVAAEPAYTEYVVQPGDYLAKISKRYNVTLSSIHRLNPSIKKDVIRVGQKIKLPGKVDVGEQKAPVKATKTAKRSVVSTAAYTGPTKEYVVKNGDTLGAVAYGNGLNIRQLKQLNGLTSDSLKVGQKLKIPAEKVAPVAKKAAAAAPAKSAAAPVAAPVAASAAAVAAPVAAPAQAAPALVQENKAEEAPAPAEAAAAPAPVPAAPATATYVVQEGDDMTGVSIRWGVSAAEIRELNNLGENDQLVPGQIIKLPAEAQQ